MPTFEDLRSIAMSLPEVEEHRTWGTDINWRVGNKMFAVTGDESSTGVSIKASLDAQADLIDLDQETFSRAAYVGRFGWVSVDLGRVDIGLLEDLIRNAWRSTAPAKLRGRLSE